MASWFKQRRDKDDEPADGSAEDSTIEVKAQVIADAVRAAEQAPPTRQVGPQAGIAADGVVSGGDFTEQEPPQSAAAIALDQALAERRSLVQLCLYALDRAKSPGVVERLEEGLASVGVDAIRPEGTHFDPAYHEAGGTVATAEETLDGVVAETEVVGFADRGEVLRVPIVTVYSKGAS